MKIVLLAVFLCSCATQRELDIAFNAGLKHGKYMGCVDYISFRVKNELETPDYIENIFSCEEWFR